MITDNKNKLTIFCESSKMVEQELRTKLDSIMKLAEDDGAISDELDTESLRTNKLLTKYLRMYTEESLVLKDMYTTKEKIKLERWKYYSGKQTERYSVDNGILHEKILKMDIDKYLAADDKLIAINDLVTVQKEIGRAHV